MSRFPQWWPCLEATLALVLLGPAEGPAQPVTRDDVDARVRDALKLWEVPGCAVVVVQDGKVAYLKGFGVKELGKKDPVTAETVFPLASCTKGFTTVALAALVDEGKMAWDDPVRKHLDFFRLADPLADANVTLRDLVTHRTGVGSHDMLWYRSTATPEELVRKVGRLPPSRSFRSTFQYQSIMYTAAGLAVGRASGSSWEEQVRRRFLDPLEMDGTSFTTAEAEQKADRQKKYDLARPHRKDRQGRLAVIPPYRTAASNAAGSMLSNARDLGPWLVFQLGDGTYQRQRLVSAEGLAETHTPQVPLRLEGAARVLSPETVQMSYGMGWVIQDYRGRPLVSHAGVIDGFRAHITLAPRDRLGLAILSNAHATRLNLALSNQLVDLFLRLPYRDWNDLVQKVVKAEEAATTALIAERRQKRHPGTKPSHPPQAYAGAYENPAYGTVRVRVEDGELVWEWGAFRCPLEHYHYDTFIATDEGLNDPLVVFTLGAGGAVASLRTLEVDFKKAQK